MTLHGSAQLSSAKFYGSEGMLALSAMLRHATRYGLKYVFVADSYYEPILTFAGWRQIDSYDHGNITVWTNPAIPFAKPIPSPFRPPRWQGIMWGTVPVGVSLITIILALLQSRKLAGRRAAQSLEPEERPLAPPLSPAPASVLSSEGRA
jgi:hypothetical protein